MKNKDLQEFLFKYPDEAPIMITMHTEKDGDFWL